jgi:hypothetical protein
MNKQQIVAKIMIELNSMGLVQSSNIKSQHDLDLFMNQLGMGLEESDLLNTDFLTNGFKEIRSGRAGVKDFYPSVPTFIAACTPKFEQWGLPTAQDAYNQASKVAGSHFKSNLASLVYMAGMNHWAALGEGKGFKEFCRRYDSLFQKWVRGNLVLIGAPISIEAPKQQPKTEQEKAAGHDVIDGLMKGLDK